MIPLTEEASRGKVLSIKDPLKAQAWEGVGTVLSPPPLGGGGAELGRAVSSSFPSQLLILAWVDRRQQLCGLWRSGSAPATATMPAAAGVLLLLLSGTIGGSQAQRPQQRRQSPAHQQRGRVQGALSWDLCS